MAKLRSEVTDNKKWDLTDFFTSDEAFEEFYDKIKKKLPELRKYKSNISFETAYECLSLYSEISRGLERLYVYAHLKRDEDTADGVYQALLQRAEMLLSDFSVESSFIIPSLSQLSTSVLREMLNSKAYQNYTMMISEVIREKKHILTRNEEKLLSEIGLFTGDFKNIFTMFDNADIKFQNIKMPDGAEEELTHGSYGVLLRNEDQNVRKQAFDAYYDSYEKNINTVCATYAGCVKKNCAIAKIREYKSALDKALEADNIHRNVHKSLLKSVKKALSPMHDYITLRKKILRLDEQHMYDLYVPLVADAKMELEYDDAYKLVLKALAPLGAEYIRILEKAYDDRWIDVEETQNKRSGAYSWGAYDARPVVLLNYQKTLNDIFTIAHEMGHAMHTYFSTKNQCYEKADYSIFTAEIASTVNEILLLKYLMKGADDKLKKYLLSYYLDMFRTTVFRQTMFSEFETFAHGEIENGNPLTVKSLSDKYYQLNKTYYGSSVIHDEKIALEWCRIPHFYNAFYVYKYATGFISANNIVTRLLWEREYVPRYLDFLSSGGSKLPLDLLLEIDIDLTSPLPYKNAMREFKYSLFQLKELMGC